MSHEKKHLPQAVILSKMRYVGFSREPVQDDSKDTRVSGIGAPASDYRLTRSRWWIDARKTQ